MNSFKLVLEGNEDSNKKICSELCYLSMPKIHPCCTFLQPLPIPERVWEDIVLDFITGMPWSKEYKAILVIVDRLTKYSHLYRWNTLIQVIAEIFVKKVVWLHQIPDSMVSDHDPLFMNLFWEVLLVARHVKNKPIPGEISYKAKPR